jgi:tripartite-type tricarboxylate transporter receptor subunit TctC
MMAGETQVGTTRRGMLALTGSVGAGLVEAGLTGARPGLARPAQAQEAWPNRPIRVIVPFPAGGTTDMLARLYGQRLTETLGQSVLVENRGGGGPEEFAAMPHIQITHIRAMVAAVGLRAE